jgi:uncharacterized protein
MLERTFIHLPGVGPKTERGLWEQGCFDWDCYLSGYPGYSVGSASKRLCLEEIQRSKESLIERRHQYFKSRLKQAEVWRAWPHFKNSCVYLDIETDGGMREDSVTTIGMWDGKDFVCLVKGDDIESFRDRISHYSMIVTFFGGGFDIPVLERRFPGLTLDQIHIDLCPLLRKLGYRGGLKKIEKNFGIQRSPETEGLTGYDAVKLWRSYLCWGKDSALDLLIAYNREDCVNLEQLASVAYEASVQALQAEPSTAYRRR